MLSIAAVAGILLLLPASASEASANESTGGDGADHAAPIVPAALDVLPCTPAGVPAAPRQQAPETEDCETGEEAECVSDESADCFVDAVEDEDECLDEAKSWFGRVLCRAAYKADVIGCYLRILAEVT